MHYAFYVSYRVPSLADAHAKSGGKNIAFFGPNVSPLYILILVLMLVLAYTLVLTLVPILVLVLRLTTITLSPCHRKTQVRTWHNNERAVQIRLLKQLFFSPTGFPNWCLASNVIDPKKEHGAAAAAKNMTSNKAPTPTLNRAVRLTGIWTTITKVAELQLLLTSDSLYKNHEAYAILSEGFEHGHMRQQCQSEPQPLSDTLTIAAEAHFRMELYYAMETIGFHHGLSQAPCDDRVRQWQAMIPKVFEDRRANEADAWAQRQAQLNEDPDAMADEDCNDEGEEGAEGAEGASVPYAVDPKYL